MPGVCLQRETGNDRERERERRREGREGREGGSEGVREEGRKEEGGGKNKFHHPRSVGGEDLTNLDNK